MKELGLIGFGRFGQLIYRHLSEAVNMLVYDPLQEQKTEFTGVRFASLDEVCSMPVLMLAVPVSALDNVSRAMSPHIKPGTLVMDVCAVKKYPMEVLGKNLPAGIEILGSHPLFGPDSAAASLDGHIIILTPESVSTETLRTVKIFWNGLGVRVIEMSPDEQDRLMAWTLALTHFLGRGLTRLPLPDTPIATRDFQNLLKLVQKVNNDTVELFQDMHRYNPYAREMRAQLLKSLSGLDEELDSLDARD